jgi:2-furoyl-CoA dehydrogenase large subunit
VRRISETHFRAEVTLGIGPIKGRYRVEAELSDLDPPQAATLTGSADGALGFGRGRGIVTLTGEGDATRVAWRYEAAIGGRIASIGGRLLDGAARVIIGQFFAALADSARGEPAPRGLAGWLRRRGSASWFRVLSWWRR